jgi:hypothetical protein
MRSSWRLGGAAGSGEGAAAGTALEATASVSVGFFNVQLLGDDGPEGAHLRRRLAVWFHLVGRQPRHEGGAEHLPVGDRHGPTRARQMRPGRVARRLSALPPDAPRGLTGVQHDHDPAGRTLDDVKRGQDGPKIQDGRPRRHENQVRERRHVNRVRLDL